MKLNINKLIEVAESVVHDEQLGFASMIQKPVNEFEQDGEYYTVFVMVQNNRDRAYLPPIKDEEQNKE